MKSDIPGPKLRLNKLIPSLRQFLGRSVRAGLQRLHQISYNTFSLPLRHI